MSTSAGSARLATSACVAVPRPANALSISSSTAASGTPPKPKPAILLYGEPSSANVATPPATGMTKPPRPVAGAGWPRSPWLSAPLRPARCARPGRNRRTAAHARRPWSALRHRGVPAAPWFVGLPGFASAVSIHPRFHLLSATGGGRRYSASAAPRPARPGRKDGLTAVRTAAARWAGCGGGRGRRRGAAPTAARDRSGPRARRGPPCRDRRTAAAPWRCRRARERVVRRGSVALDASGERVLGVQETAGRR